jgi:oligosaccharyltransferase complex subunit alpha (ribophorin I)
MGHVREPWTYEITLPTPLAENGTANIVLETVQTDATYPWPREAAQGDPQVLKFDTDLFVVSPYETVVQRTKIRCVRVRRARGSPA